MITPEEAYAWHVSKDKGGPTFSGNRAWQSFMTFLEEKLKQYGVIDISKNKWTYDRWYTSDWPDGSRWTLVSGGESIRVAHYGAYSGSTGADGVTAELVFYDPASPPASVEGGIAVFTTTPLSGPRLGASVSDDAFAQLLKTMEVRSTLQEGQAAGGIVVFDMSYDRLAGLYTFPVPVSYDVPTLYVDRVAGAQVLEDARSGKKATLRLLAEVEPTETYQLMGYLPGKDYGTARDEQILLITHTDGPSISQDNGAFGLLGIIGNFSDIPQAERPRTLMVFLDNRHYMPGGERAFDSQDWFAKNPEAKRSIVSLIATEHLGQIEYREEGDVYEPTGEVEPSFLWTRDNQSHGDLADKAVRDSQWPRVSVQREGAQGTVWYGMGRIATTWDIPAFAMMGTMGAYWATTAGIDAFNKELFCAQVSAMTQLTGELMRLT